MKRDITYQPLAGDWPRQDTAVRKSRYTFKAPWVATERELLYEVAQLGGWEVVISVDVTATDLRRDGAGMLASATVLSPRVIVWLESDAGPMSFPVDMFEHWRANVRAVALGLESLRRLDRYGMGDTGQQYTGWLALPAAGESSDIAAAVIADAANMALGEVLADPAVAVRQAQIRTHPDRGGDPATFQAVTEAAAALR